MATPQIEEDINPAGEYAEPRHFEIQVWTWAAPPSFAANEAKDGCQTNETSDEHEVDALPWADHSVFVLGYQMALSRKQACELFVRRQDFQTVDQLLSCYVVDPDQSSVYLVAQESPDMWSQPSDEEILAAMVVSPDQRIGVSDDRML